MMKRCLSALICLVLSLVLLSVTAQAAPAMSITVLGTEVTGGEYWKKDPDNDAFIETTAADYTVRYAAAEQKLYLNDLTLTHTIEAGVPPYINGLIEANGDLHLVLEGDSVISVTRTDAFVSALSVTGKLTVAGTGSLKATSINTDASSYGIQADGGITVNSGRLTGVSVCTAGDRSYGIYISSGDIRVTGGSLVGSCGAVTGSGRGISASGNIEVSSGTLMGVSNCPQRSPYKSPSIAAAGLHLIDGNVTATTQVGTGIWAPVTVEDGTLRAEIDLFGTAIKGSVTVNGGNVTAIGRSNNNAPDDSGIYGIEGNLRVNGGHVTVKGINTGNAWNSGICGSATIYGGYAELEGVGDPTWVSEGVVFGNANYHGGELLVKGVKRAIGSARTLNLNAPNTVTASVNKSGTPTTPFVPGDLHTYEYLHVLPAPLAAPTDLAWNGESAGWQPVTYATGYKVQLYEGGTADANKVGGEMSVTGTSCDFASLIEANGSGVYYFKVMATLGTETRHNSPYSTSGSLDCVLYTVSGTVKDAKGVPIEQAGVSAGGQSVMTNAAGKYMLTSLRNGSYTLTVSKAGYHNATKSITVSGAALAGQDVTLTALPPGTVETPAFAPVAGTYTSAQNVMLSCATTGAQIRYTTDGTEPSESSALYSGAIPIAATTTLKAKAYKSGMTPSDTATAEYVINIAPVPAPGGGSVPMAGGGYTGNTYQGNITVNAKGELVCTVQADCKKCTSVIIDGVQIKIGEGCTVDCGSTIVTIRPSYLATLKDGAHTLLVQFTDGRYEGTLAEVR